MWIPPFTRSLTTEAVSAVAEGRVWTGRQAWTRGLVDQLGGLEEALDAMKEAVGIPLEAPVAVERAPRPRRLWRFSLDLRRQDQGRLGELVPLLPDLRAFFRPMSFVLKERVWAILPFDLRFF